MLHLEVLVLVNRQYDPDDKLRRRRAHRELVSIDRERAGTVAFQEVAAYGSKERIMSASRSRSADGTSENRRIGTLAHEIGDARRELDEYYEKAIRNTYTLVISESDDVVH
jgi:hypothetical protein